MTLNEPSPLENQASQPDKLENDLKNANYSRAYPRRNQLRAWITEYAQKQQSVRRVRSGLRLVAEGGVLILLLAAFLAVTSGLLRPPASTPGEPSFPLPNVITPLSVPTYGPPQFTPQPVPTLYPPLDNNSNPDTLRLSIYEPTWNSLAIEIETTLFQTTNQAASKRFTEAWLDRSGRGLVLASDILPAEININYDVTARYVTLANGRNLISYDKTTRQTSTKPLENQSGLNPLMQVSPEMELVYPGFLMILSSSPRIIGADTVLERPTVVADWGNSRIWVDANTGMLLRFDRYTGLVGQSSVQSSTVVKRLFLEYPVSDSLFNPPNLAELTFEPVSAPRPTPYAPAITTTITPQTSPGLALSNRPKEGFIFLESSGQAPFRWQVYALSAACLPNPPCAPLIALPGKPNVQISSLAWAPDGSLGVFSDTNNNQIVGFDPKLGVWLRVSQGFFQPGLVWSLNSKNLAALTSSNDPYDDRLVLVRRADWKMVEVPFNLKGNKTILGWIDDRLLLVDIPSVTSFKGGAPTWFNEFRPGVYQVDTITGESRAIDWGAPGKGGALLSPRGNRLLFNRTENGKGIIAVAGIDGSNLSVIAEGSNSAWSPDGQWVLFWRSEGFVPNGPNLQSLYRIRADGTRLAKTITVESPPDIAWNPDGKTLLLGLRDTIPPKMLAINLETGGQQEVPLEVLNGAGAWGLLGWLP